MRRKYVRQISTEAGIQCVENWGYPRGISELEKDEGIWVADTLEDDELPDVLCITGVAWLIPGPGDNSVSVHGCSSRHVYLGTERNMRALELIAEMKVGASRLYSVLPVGELAESCGPEALAGLPIPVMRRYFRMRGWSLDTIGAYKDLGIPEVLQ